MLRHKTANNEVTEIKHKRYKTLVWMRNKKFWITADYLKGGKSEYDKHTKIIS